jgi:hypothetical protein
MDEGSAPWHHRAIHRLNLLLIRQVRMHRQFVPAAVWMESGPQADLTRARSR